MIVASAIKFYTNFNFEYPIIIAAASHSEATERMKNLIPNYDEDSVCYGYLNDKDAFLDPYAAKYEAIHSNQLRANSDTRALCDEDLNIQDVV